MTFKTLSVRLDETEEELYFSPELMGKMCLLRPEDLIKFVLEHLENPFRDDEAEFKAVELRFDMNKVCTDIADLVVSQVKRRATHIQASVTDLKVKKGCLLTLTMPHITFKPIDEEVFIDEEDDDDEEV